jgi:hypothetical protein
MCVVLMCVCVCLFVHFQMYLQPGLYKVPIAIPSMQIESEISVKLVKR